MISIILGISLLVNGILIYSAVVSLRKIELLESTIDNFYQYVSLTLNTMRALDEKQMFEKDDEVGSVFSQLTDVINDLRPMIYGSANFEEEKQDIFYQGN
jgi:hypothetical protein